MINQVSIRSASITTNLGRLLAYSGASSEAVILAPEMNTPPHEGYLKQYCRYQPLLEAPSELESTSYISEAIAVRSFRDATISPRLGVVRQGRGPIVTETTKGIRFRFSDWMQQLNSEEFRRIPADYISGNYVYSAHGDYHVYGHFLFETICTAYLLNSLLVEGRASLVVPKYGSTWYSQLLDLLGIPITARYRLSGDATRFENLILSSTCDSRNTFYPNGVMKSVSEVLKQRAGAAKEYPCTERLYLTRRGSSNTARRDYVEDEALSEMLSKLGFQTLNPATMSIVEQIRLFSRAQIIVGIHSSAFANLMFSPSSTLVIDILPSHWVNAGGMFTKNITNLYGQKYIYLVAESFKEGDGYSCTLAPELVYNTVRQFFD